MQSDDPPFPGIPSKINDPCLHKLIEGERILDSIESVIMPTRGQPVDIQRKHDLLIPQVLHIVHIVCLLGFP